MKYEQLLKTIFVFLFIIFITIYITHESGYYEYELHKKVELTNEQIQKFESDIKNNVNIDVNDYIDNKMEDYSNNFSKIGASFSSFTSKYIKEGIEGVLNIITNMLT